MKNLLNVLDVLIHVKNVLIMMIQIIMVILMNLLLVKALPIPVDLQQIFIEVMIQLVNAI